MAVLSNLLIDVGFIAPFSDNMYILPYKCIIQSVWYPLNICSANDQINRHMYKTITCNNSSVVEYLL